MLAVVALALGIGLTTTMFSIVNGAILRGLPFPESDRVVHVAPFDIADQDDEGATERTFVELAARQTSFEELAAFYGQTLNVVGPNGVPERYQGAWVTANTFRLIKVAPVLGRDFRDEESRPGAAPVVMIGHRVWQDRFGGDPAVIGQALRVNGTPMTIIGVMPEKFRFPSRNDIWPALVIDSARSARPDGVTFEVIGRLVDGVSMTRAGAEMATVWHQFEQAFPDEYEGQYTIEVKTFIEEFIGSETIAALWTMLVAVLGVLVIACANVANLVLARTVDRSRELAVRTALGAGRGRIVGQTLLEVLLLTVVGAVLGLAIAQIGVMFFNRAIVDTDPPFWIDIRVDAAVLLFVTMTTVAAALAAGVVPAVRASRMDPMVVLANEGRGDSGIRVGRFMRGLVVIELALSFGLLVMSAFAIQTIVKMGAVDFGFAMRDVWSARVTLPTEAYPDDERRRQFTDAVVARLATQPGVRRAAATTGVPIGGGRATIKLPDQVYEDDRDHPEVHRLIVSAGFFETLGVRLREGREFDDRDTAASLPVAIVNESFARTHFGQATLDRRLALASGPHQEWRTVIGVVPDLGMGRMPGDTVSDGVYVPMAQVPTGALTLVARVAGPSPLTLTGPVRDIVRDLDPNLPIYDVATLWDATQSDAWAYRVFGTLFLAFGAGALFLATIGLYGVMSFAASRRTHEIGIRMAMGAAAADVIRLVLRQGGFQIVAGLALGVGLAALLSSSLTILIFDLSPLDPLTFATVAAVLALTGLIACLVPARRASAVDPLVALRVR